MIQVVFCIVGEEGRQYIGQLRSDRLYLVVKGGVSALLFQGRVLTIEGPGELLRREVVGTDGQLTLHLRQASQQKGW